MAFNFGQIIKSPKELFNENGLERDNFIEVKQEDISHKWQYIYTYNPSPVLSNKIYFLSLLITPDMDNNHEYKLLAKRQGEDVYFTVCLGKIRKMGVYDINLSLKIDQLREAQTKQDKLAQALQEDIDKENNYRATRDNCLDVYLANPNNEQARLNYEDAEKQYQNLIAEIGSYRGQLAEVNALIVQLTEAIDFSKNFVTLQKGDFLNLFNPNVSYDEIKLIITKIDTGDTIGFYQVDVTGLEGNPHDLGWYILQNDNTYVRTNDESIIDGVDYFLPVEDLKTSVKAVSLVELMESFPQPFVKIGIQGSPGSSVFINNSEVKLNSSGIFELDTSDNLEISSIKCLPFDFLNILTLDQSHDKVYPFIIDYEKKKEQQGG